MLKIKIMNIKRCLICRTEQPLNMYIGVNNVKCESCLTCRKQWWKSPEKTLKKIKDKMDNKEKEKYIICQCGYQVRNRKQNIEEHSKTNKHKKGKEEIEKTHYSCECGCVVLNKKYKNERHKITDKHKRLMNEK